MTITRTELQNMVTQVEVANGPGQQIRCDVFPPVSGGADPVVKAVHADRALGGDSGECGPCTLCCFRIQMCRGPAEGHQKIRSEQTHGRQLRDRRDR